MGKRGFTLLEVMIALAIAAGLLVTLLYTLNHHLDVSMRHETLTVATILGKNKLLELRQGAAPETGKFPEPYSDYSFVTEIAESSYPGVSVISVAVKRGKERVTYRDLVRSEALKK